MALARPAAPPPAAVVETIDDAEGFRQLAPSWAELLASSPSDSLFLTWEWLFTWWKHLAASRRLSILAVRSEGRLIAIAPLAVRRAQWGRLSPFRSVEFLGSGLAGSDYLDLIVRAGWESLASEALADHLGRGRTMIDLTRVRRDRAAAWGCARALCARGWSWARRETAVCPYIDLRGMTWARYVDGLGAAHRANFRRRLRALTASSLRFEQAQDEEQRPRFLAQMMALHRLRWQGRGRSEAFQGPGLAAFHREFSALALRRGWLRLFVLHLGGQPVAALYGFLYRRTFYFYQSGFDPDYARRSVGLVAMGLTIRKAIEEGAAEFDLLHGHEDYKFLWAKQVREIERLEIYPPRALGAVQRKTNEVGRSVRSLARRILSRPRPGSIPTALKRRNRGDAPCLEIS
jgi:CelD/BcsL family acetyltransferase involved in cellulose biosynthesis